jgi:hypothetical protein
MKAVKLIKRPNAISSLDLLKVVLENPQAKGATVGDVRQRCKLLDKLEAETGDTWLLDDVEYKFLKQALEAFTFSIATKQMLEIIDGVTEAKEPEAAADKAA